MSGRSETFDALFREAADPWGFETSDYERDKHAATLEAVGGGPFRSGLELGCAFGTLTRGLLPRCHRLTAVDVSRVALDRARAALPGPGVRWHRADLPERWPAGAYDLVVVSEFLYFLQAPEIARLAALVRRDAPDARLVLVNWTGHNDLPLDGERASALFRQGVGRTGWRTVRKDTYRLDVLDQAIR